ncbi:MAG: reverse transcriptase-like protein [Clostridiales bacterium]|nr:reverse transcriptase-like protein [Clostridiales bacterium]
MKKKYYAVKNGRNIGIYSSWSECEKQVKGYSGAEYKSFLTLKEAKDYLNGEENSEEKDICDLKDNEMIAYVDGSFDVKVGYYAYGVILFSKDGKFTYSGRGNEKDLIEMRNVSGEIKGAMVAMNIALEKNIDTLYLYYDYMGIEKWLTGEWKTNKIGTKKYKEFYDSIKDRLNVVFKKVKSHSGDTYNEEVDKLARAALKIDEN